MIFNRVYGINPYKKVDPRWIKLADLPYSLKGGSVVVQNNEIHILGGTEYNNGSKNHYKWNGSSWESVSTLPYGFMMGSAVVYNNEIHILSGITSTSPDVSRNHYKWDGSSWTSVSTLPFDSLSGQSSYSICPAVVYNNEIHWFGNFMTDSQSIFKFHYKWDGLSWKKVSTTPYGIFKGAAIVLNNEIHLIGGGTNENDMKKHYKWDGSSWTSVSTLPYPFVGDAVVFNNEIHIVLNGSLCKWNGTSWEKVSNSPYSNPNIVILNNAIHEVGCYGSGTNYGNNHYMYCSPYIK
jgi:N-acetylneuraminic acid mutarotase